jgi:predicted AlkP superfamily phosphohydrolase/phosphomutase
VLRNYYRYVDNVIGKFAALMDDNTVMAVISDHGMSPDDRRFKKTGVNSGKHVNEDGVFVMAGRHIKKHCQVEGHSILDITPTLLALYGLPCGHDMDGSVMEAIFEDDFLRGRPVYYHDGYDVGRIFDPSPIESPVDEEIAERLRSLGYIE